MTGKPKLPRLWDEKITTAKGRKVRRYSVRKYGYSFFTIWDKLKQRELPHPESQVCVFRLRSAAEDFLETTTVRSYELAMINAALDRGA